MSFHSPPLLRLNPLKQSTEAPLVDGDDQAFIRGLLKLTFDAARASTFSSTSEATLMIRHGPITVSQCSSPSNPRPPREGGTERSFPVPRITS